MRPFKELFGMALLSLTLSACAQPQPIPLGTNTRYYGYISEGAKFGVSIGDSREAARVAMAKQGFDDPEAVDCAESGGLQDQFDCAPGQMFDIYHRHRGLGHDVVSFEVESERIVKVGWSSVLVQIDS